MRLGLLLFASLICQLLLSGAAAELASAAGKPQTASRSPAATSAEQGAAGVLSFQPKLPDAKTTRHNLRDILNKPEYKDEQPQGPGLLDRIADWLAALRLRLGLGSGSWTGTFVIIVVVSLILYLLLRIFSGMEFRKFNLRDEGLQTAKQYSAGELLAQAEQAAKEEDYRGAIRLRFRAMLRQIEMPASTVLTNRQLVRVLSNDYPQVSAPLMAFVGCFEDAWYGGLCCGSAEYYEAAKLAEQVLSAIRSEAV